jgi:hypothetical protein
LSRCHIQQAALLSIAMSSMWCTFTMTRSDGLQELDKFDEIETLFYHQIAETIVLIEINQTCITKQTEHSNLITYSPWYKL